MLPCIVTWHSSILEDLPHQAVPAIAREVCASYRHANSFLGSCMGREDILAD